MLLTITSSWWALVLRGIAAIIFGLLAFIWPGITLTVLIFLFGAYALVDGLFAIVAGIKTSKDGKPWRWMFLIEGILSAAAGVIAFVMPGITALVLLALIAAWALFTGALEIAAAIQLRKQITGEWLLVFSGILSVLFGVVLLINPAAGALAVVWLIGAYAIVFGTLLLVLGFRLRGLERADHRMTPRAA